MLLFFDTETTGLCNFKADAPLDVQPHIVSLAAILCDENANELDTLSIIVAPYGKSSHPRAEEKHGISESRRMKEGIPVADALASFVSIALRASVAVAHNFKFDHMALNCAYLSRSLPSPFPCLVPFCTMEATTPVLRLPTKWGKYKFPKLEEAYFHFFPSRPPYNAHEALADTRACKDIYFQLNPPPQCQEQPSQTPLLPQTTTLESTSTLTLTPSTSSFEGALQVTEAQPQQ